MAALGTHPVIILAVEHYNTDGCHNRDYNTDGCHYRAVQSGSKQRAAFQELETGHLPLNSQCRERWVRD